MWIIIIIIIIIIKTLIKLIFFQFSFLFFSFFFLNKKSRFEYTDIPALPESIGNLKNLKEL